MSWCDFGPSFARISKQHNMDHLSERLPPRKVKEAHPATTSIAWKGVEVPSHDCRKKARNQGHMWEKTKKKNRGPRSQKKWLFKGMMKIYESIRDMIITSLVHGFPAEWLSWLVVNGITFFFQKKKSIISYLNWFESKVAAWHIAGSHWRSRTNHFALTVAVSWRNGVSRRKWNNSLEQTGYCIVKTMDRVCVEVDQDRNKFNRRSQYVFHVCSKGYTYGLP